MSRSRTMDGPSQIKRLRGGVLEYAAQATSQIDAEIGKKDHFWMETNYLIRTTT